MAQNDRILEYLMDKGSISGHEARRLCHCERLASRIYDLKSVGHDIRTVMQYEIDENGDPVRWAKYYYHGFNGKGNK